MGLFDRIFGRNKESEQTSEILTESLTESLADVVEPSERELTFSESLSLLKDSISASQAALQSLSSESEVAESVSNERELPVSQTESLSDEPVPSDSLTESLSEEPESSDSLTESLSAAPEPLGDQTESLSDVQAPSDSQTVSLSDEPEASDSLTESLSVTSEPSDSQTESLSSESTPSESQSEQPPSATEPSEPAPSADEEDIILDIDALADIFAAQREEIDEKYSVSLSKTAETFRDGFNELLANFRQVDDEFFEQLEETLILSDVGAKLSLEITDELRQEAKLEKATSPEELRRIIIEKMVDKFGEESLPTTLDIQPAGSPTVFLFIGVNGVGKTTTIGKLAARYKAQGKRVLLAAADTFRAGAIDQLVEWGKRADVPVIAKKAGTDPAAVVFDAMKALTLDNYDILLIDTAGRLQNKDNLMKELEKINRVIQRELPSAPHETLLALDATTGQNAISQAEEFSKVVPLTGIVLTKLDGSAKGGIVLSIVQSLGLPVKLVGLGEKLEDLADFDAVAFMRGLFGELVA